MYVPRKGLHRDIESDSSEDGIGTPKNPILRIGLDSWGSSEVPYVGSLI